MTLCRIVPRGVISIATPSRYNALSKLLVRWFSHAKRAIRMLESIELNTLQLDTHYEGKNILVIFPIRIRSLGNIYSLDKGGIEGKR